MKRIFAALSALIFASPAYAAWTPLIQSEDFTGIKTDMMTAVAGFITLLLIIVGVYFLTKIFR